MFCISRWRVNSWPETSASPLRSREARIGEQSGSPYVTPCNHTLAGILTFFTRSGRFLRIARIDISTVARSSNEAELAIELLMISLGSHRSDGSRTRGNRSHRPGGKNREERRKTRENVATEIAGLTVTSSTETSNTAVDRAWIGNLGIADASTKTVHRIPNVSRRRFFRGETRNDAEFRQNVPGLCSGENTGPTKGNLSRPVSPDSSRSCSLLLASRKRNTPGSAFIHTWTTVGARLLPPP
mgnify:CR=1 FL=1